MKSTLSRTEFMKICGGVTRQALYKAINAGHVKLNSKNRVLFEDPTTQRYYEKQIAKRAAPGNGNNTTCGYNDAGEEVLTLEHQKLIEEVGRLKADRELKELKLAQGRDESINRGTFGAVIFHYIDALNINMLNTPDMIIDTLIDKVKSGSTRGDMIKYMRNIIQNEIKSTKKQVKERLK